MERANVRATAGETENKFISILNDSPVPKLYTRQKTKSSNIM